MNKMLNELKAVREALNRLAVSDIIYEGMQYGYKNYHDAAIKDMESVSKDFIEAKATLTTIIERMEKEEDAGKTIAEFVASQESLGEDFQRIMEENNDELYVRWGNARMESGERCYCGAKNQSACTFDQKPDNCIHSKAMEG